MNTYYIILGVLLLLGENLAKNYPMLPTTCIKDSKVLKLIQEINTAVDRNNKKKESTTYNIVEVDVRFGDEADDLEPFDFDVDPTSEEMIFELRAILEQIKQLYQFLGISDMYDQNLRLEEEKTQIATNKNLDVKNKLVIIMAWDHIVDERLKMIITYLDMACKLMEGIKKTQAVPMVTVSTTMKRSITKKVIETMVKEIGTENIINFIIMNDCTMRFTAFDELLNNLRANDVNWMYVAFSIKEYYTAACQPSVQDTNTLQNKIPKCIRDAVFSNLVSIKNVDTGEYLITDRYTGPGSARLVFTWRPKNLNTNGYWKVTKYSNGNNVYFVHNVYNNRLTASTDIQGQKRKSYTNSNTDNQALWKIVPEGNQCYLSNVAFDEYLYADDNVFCGERRHVGTWIPESTRSSLKWEITAH